MKQTGSGEDLEQARDRDGLGVGARGGSEVCGVFGERQGHRRGEHGSYDTGSECK